MKKALFIFSFVMLMFVFKSFGATQAEAAQTFNGILDNRNGSIAVSVVVNYYRSAVFRFQRTYVVTAGSSYSVVGEYDGAVNFPPYSLYWSTGCSNSTYQAMTPNSESAAYDFGTIDVHCRTINTPLTVTATSCSLVSNQNNGSISWSIVSTNYGGPNIDHFKVYKVNSSGGNTNPNSDTSPTTVAYTTNTVAYSLTMPNIASGVWQYSVKAYSKPDKNITAQNGYFECGQGISSPGNLSSVVNCVSTGVVRLSYNWSPALPGTYNYKTQASSDQVNWQDWMVPSPTTSTFVSSDVTMTPGFFGARFYWRVQATPSPATGAVYYSNSAYWDFPSTCSLTYTPADVSSFAPIVCASTNTNWNEAGNDPYSGSIPPGRVKFKWYRGHTRVGYAGAKDYSVIQAEQLEYGLDPNFSPGTFTALPVTSLNPAANDRQVLVASGNLNQTNKVFYRINTKMNDVWYPSILRYFVVPWGCNNGNASYPVNVPTIESVYIDASNTYNGGYSYCHNSQFWVHLNWNIRLSGNPYTPNTLFKIYKGQFFNNLTQVGTVNTLSFDFQSGAFDYWQVVPYWDGVTPGIASTQTRISVMPCIGGLPSANPSNLSASYYTGFCPNNMQTTWFKFWDNATNEGNVPGYSGYGYYLDVSSEPFTGPNTTAFTNTWGTRRLYTSIFSTAGQTSATQGGAFVRYDWYPGSYTVNTPGGPLDYGNANPGAGAGNELIPILGVRYYWRVRAVNQNGFSSYVYPDGTTASTTYPSGISSDAPSCTPLYDLSATIVPGSWKNNSGVVTQSFSNYFDVNLNIEVRNVNSYLAAASSPATYLDIYYGGPPFGQSSGQQTVPNCTTTSVATAPTDYIGVVKRYSVPALNKGSTITIPVSFNVGPITPGSYTAYAYVVPTCTFSPAGSDPNWANNKSGGFSYTVGIDKFFETRGGDVGANGNISVGINSSILTTPNTATYQSQYMITGKNIAPNVNVASGGTKINNYNKSQVISGGVYKYFADKFRQKAISADVGMAGCTITSGSWPNKFYYCNGDVKIDVAAYTYLFGVGSHPVFFIDGDLIINQPFGGIYAYDTPVFIVKGNIKVSKTVNTLRGVFITQKSFIDGYDGGEVSGANKLTLTGAVYADGLENNDPTQQPVQLLRYFGPDALNNLPLNANTPSELFIFNPANIYFMNSILATAPVGWAEKAP